MATIRAQQVGINTLQHATLTDKNHICNDILTITKSVWRAQPKNNIYFICVIFKVKKNREGNRFSEAMT